MSAVHHHLVRAGTRLRTGLVIESGEPRDIHHMATLIGYGASAINPYLMFESLDELTERSLLPEDLETEEAEKRIVKAIGKGLLKTMSKMGISTIQSYCGAQIFEAVGLERELIDVHFTGTASRIGGIGIDGAGGRGARSATSAPTRAPTARCCRSAACCSGVATASATSGTRTRSPACSTPSAPRSGASTAAPRQRPRERQRQWRQRRSATAAPPRDAAGALRRLRTPANDEATRARRRCAGFMRLRAPTSRSRDEVEPATDIVKRFSTGAMSLGSLSREAHETLAIAMNRSAASPTPARAGRTPRALSADANGDSAPLGDQAGRLRPLRGDDRLPRQRRPAADQDGPGRQARRGRPAARPQGRRLHRQDPHSTPGVGPDLAAAAPRHLLDRGPQAADLRPALRQPDQLGLGQARLRGRRRHRRLRCGQGQRRPRHDLRRTTAAPAPRPSPRCRAPAIPWEIGLAETQQTLLLNDLRSRVRVEVDGQLKTGRDVVIGALLGADEFGFSTAPLIAMGCIMMRVCHLNTCPVGVATQDPELRALPRHSPST